MKKIFRIALTALCLLTASTRAQAEFPQETMPLNEIRPGMEGHWRTVVSGTEIEEFPLKVLGVIDDFIGPGRSLIICEASDETNILSGPVSGMSGSPVFIDGKLVGAYAYGFPWAKEQAIIGVTPIADMLEIFDRFDENESSITRASRYPANPETSVETVLFENLSTDLKTDLPSASFLRSHLQPLPTTLNISGISPQTLHLFANEFRALGVEPMLVPMGKTATEIDTDLQPGSAVAGVLLDGDFNFAGTGTVTYRDGDRLLAFGHPFFGFGTTDIPMAPAEIITVIRSVQSSFKLSSTGPVIGSIYQDRLSAIAGKIGRKSPVVQIKLNIEDHDGFSASYSGNLFQHPQFSPLISAMALNESLTRTMEASDRQTFFIKSTWEIEGHEPIVYEDVATGPDSPMHLTMQHLSLYRNLADNFFGTPTIKSITYDISFRNEWLISELESAFINRREAKRGESVTVDLILRNFQGEQSREQLKVPIPADLVTENAILFIGDAASSRAYDPNYRVKPTSLEQVLEQARQHVAKQSIYVKLLRPASGLRVAGVGMPDLLPSVAAAIESPQSKENFSSLHYATIWETELSVPNEFRGYKTFQLKIK